jgi:plastocyanin
VILFYHEAPVMRKIIFVLIYGGFLNFFLMLKKMSPFFLSLFLILALSGCQTDSATDSTESIEVETSESVEVETPESTEVEVFEPVEVEVETSESVEVETTETEVETSESNESEVVESTETETYEPAEATVTSVSVVGTDFAFAPSSLSFTAGQTVQLTFQNNGGAPHNLVVEGTDIKTATIGGGESTSLTFTAPAAGTYTFYCGVGGHRDAGMTGTLVTQ